MNATKIHYASFLLVIIIIIVGGAFGYLYWYKYYYLPPYFPLPNPSPECSMDSDCRLIYSSCSCAAVPINMEDQKALERLPARDKNVMCFVNSCSLEHAKAICLRGSCHVKFP